MDDIDRAQAREQEFRDDAIAAALDLHPHEGLPSLSHCEECGAKIPVKRQRAVAGVTTCVGCQSKLEMAATGVPHR